MRPGPFARLLGRLDPRAALRFSRNRGAVLGGWLVVVVLLLAFLGPWAAPYDPDQQFEDGLTREGRPVGVSSLHWLGTDTVGRDELSRLLHGGLLSMSVAMGATLIALVLGLTIGIVAGYRRGRFDAIAMQVADVTSSIPFLLLAIAVNKVVDRPGLVSLAVLLGALSWTTLARVTRTKTRQVRELEYVQAARALGMSEARVVVQHVMPNVLGPAIILGTTLVAQMILVESAMSFLGVGVQPPTSTWGAMLRDGQGMMALEPQMVFYPGVVIALAVFGFNLLGEGLQGALDPKDTALPGARKNESRIGIGSFFALAAGVAALFAFLPPIPTHPAFEGAGSDTPHHGGTFVFWHESDVRGLDPHVSYDELSGMAIKLMFEGLIDYDDDLHFVPRLARELPDVSEDGLVYTFRLRQGVHFHNGRELVADDVRWSMEHMLDPDTHSPGTSFYELIDGIAEFRDHRAEHIRGIEVLDPLTVRFTLTRPDQTFLNAMAMMFAYPVPRENYEAHPDDVSRHPIGTGAYILDEWEPGVRITFRRNPDFFIAGQPYCDRMVYEVNLSRTSAFMRFVTADVDTIHRMSSTDYLWFRAQEAWRPYWVETPVLDMYGLVMNTELEPFTNVHVRRALSFAVDRERWQRAKQNRFLVNGTALPPSMVSEASTVVPQTFDLARAREEMALAGHPVRQVGDRWVAEGLEDQPIQMWLTEGDSGRVWGELAQQDLAAIGLEIEVRQVSFPIWLSETGHRRTAALLLGGWSADFPDASNFMDVLFHSRSIHETASENRSFYQRPEVDQLLDRARVERDRTTRTALYDQAMGLVVEDAPWAFILTNLKLYAWQPYVRNYRPHPVWDQMYRDVWLDLPRQRVSRALREAGAVTFAPAAPLGGTW